MAAETVKTNSKNGTDAPKINEPSEVDPCIIEFKNSSYKPKFLENTVRRGCEKTGLSPIGFYIATVLLILLIILFIVVLVLAITWPRQPHHLQFPICEKPACLRAAAQIQDSWNSSISPCKNVWQWACNSWLNKNPLLPDSSLWSVHQQVKLEESGRIHDYISTLELPLLSQTVEWKMKYLYEGCLDVNNVNVDKEKPLLRIISELGGWYILRDWNLQDFDRSLMIKQLHVEYGVSPYFRISVQPNPRLPGSHSITISPSGLGLPDRYYYYTAQNDPIQKAYKQLIQDVVISFSTSMKVNGQKFGEDTFSYEKRIAEITPSLHDTVNPVNTYNPIKLSELTITVPSLPLQDILTLMYPKYNITEETEVIVTSLYYLTEVSRIVASTDSETLNSYLIWTLVREYLPYLSTEYTSTLNLFEQEVYGFHGALPRWKKCIALVQNIMGFAVESALESKYPISRSTTDLVESIFEEIRNSAQQKLSKMQISSAFYNYLSKKLSRLQLQVGLPSSIKNSSYIKEYYSKLMISKGSLFNTIVNSLFFKRRIEERLLVSTYFQEQSLVSHIVAKPDEVSYVPSSNMVIVPRIMVSDPLFDNDYPSSLLYGRLGVSIATAVISSILPYESMWTADMKLLSPFHITVNESYETTTEARNCLLNFTQNNNVGSKTVPELITLSTIKHLFGVSIAHEALKNSLTDTEHIHQPSLEKLEDSALFFLAYSQNQCSVSSTQQDLYDNVVNNRVSQKSLLGAAWSYLSEFSNSLQCPNEVEQRCSDIF